MQIFTLLCHLFCPWHLCDYVSVLRRIMQIDLFTLVKPVAVLVAWVSSKMTLKLKIECKLCNYELCKLCKSFPRLPPNAKRANRARNLMTARTTSSLTILGISNLWNHNKKSFSNEVQSFNFLKGTQNFPWLDEDTLLIYWPHAFLPIFPTLLETWTMLSLATLSSLHRCLHSFQSLVIYILASKLYFASKVVRRSRFFAVHRNILPRRQSCQSK